MLRTELTGKVAVITAGAGVIGKEIVKTFAASGAAVAVCDKDLAAAKEVAASVVAGGGKAAAFGMDIRKQAEFPAIVAEIVKTFGGIDILVNNENEEIPEADRKEVQDIDMAEYDDLINAGVYGIYGWSKQCILEMVKRGGGSVVNVVSVRGVVPCPNQTAIVAVAGAQVGFTRMGGVELKNEHVRVNAVAAGLSKNEKNAADLATDEAVEKKMSHLAIHRLCNGEDIANAALFLASDDAAYITGAVLPVDGGLSAGYVRSF